MFGSVLVEMAAGVTNILCIAQMTFKTVYNALLVDWGLLFFLQLELVADDWTLVNWLQVYADLSAEVIQLSSDRIC